MASGGKRRWVVYNEALVKRVMILFSFDCLDCWYEEVRSMNVGKNPCTSPCQKEKRSV